MFNKKYFWIPILILALVMSGCFAVTIPGSESTETTISTSNIESTSNSELSNNTSQDVDVEEAITFNGLDELIEAMEVNKEQFKQFTDMSLFAINDSQYTLEQLAFYVESEKVELTYKKDDTPILLTASKKDIFTATNGEAVDKITIYGQSVPLYKNKDGLFGLVNIADSHIQITIQENEDIETLGPLLEQSTLSEMIKWHSQTWIDGLPVPFEGVTILRCTEDDAFYKYTEDTTLRDHIDRAIKDAMSAASINKNPTDSEITPTFKILFSDGITVLLNGTRMDVYNSFLPNDEATVYSLNSFNANVLYETMAWYYESCYEDEFLYNISE